MIKYHMSSGTKLKKKNLTATSTPQEMLSIYNLIMRPIILTIPRNAIVYIENRERMTQTIYLSQQETNFLIN